MVIAQPFYLTPVCVCMFMYVCYVSRLISADFSVDVFVGFNLLWKFNLCFLAAKSTVKIHLFRLHRDYSGVSQVKTSIIGGWVKVEGCTENLLEKALINNFR